MKGILLSAFVSRYINCKNMHNWNIQLN